MRRGFTLIELIVVVIVIGILATLAIPQYLTATERAKGAKAKHALSLLAQGEKLYRAENDTYIALPADNANSVLSSYIEVKDIDNDTDWAYTSSGISASTFTITATRSAGSNSGETITVNQDGTWVNGFTP